MNLLLVEDNYNISSALKYSLEQNNFKVDTCETYSDALEKTNNDYDLIILDITLPDGNGFDLANKFNVKKIFLTAMDDEDNIIKGLDLADDYMTKPFSTRELIARINKILNNSIKEIKINDITFNTDKMTVYKDSKEILLTSLEVKILNLLFNNLNKVVTRDIILEKIWDWTGNDVNDNTVSVYLKRIREKLDTDIIKTIKGIGYRIDYEEENKF